MCLIERDAGHFARGCVGYNLLARRMRIVHIITRLIVGGAQENTLLSCEGQRTRGHEVALITGPPLGPEGSLMDRAMAGGYRVEVLDEMRRAVLPQRDWRTYRRLVRRLRELRPDVVHTHSSKAGIIGRWAAHAAGVPAIIHTIHGLSFTASTWSVVNHGYRLLERLTAPITSRIVSVADAMTRQSVACRIGRPQQYVTVYSGMEIEPFLRASASREEIRRRLGIESGQIAVGTIARLFYLKGHEDLLAGAQRLCEEFANLRFLWVGDGLLRGDYEAQIRRMGLGERFILTGLVPPAQIPELVGAMDILVHPSRREGLARALAQAQLAGRPVIAYDVDGNREGLVDGRTGFLARPFDRQELLDRLVVLVKDEGLRGDMGRKGQAFAAGRFAASVMLNDLEAVYASALSARAR